MPSVLEKGALCYATVLLLMQTTNCSSNSNWIHSFFQTQRSYLLLLWPYLGDLLDTVVQACKRDDEELQA